MPEFAIAPLVACVPPEKSSVAPLATENVPALAPPPARLNVPAVTFTAPALFSVTPPANVLTPADDFVTVAPARLLNVTVPPLQHASHVAAPRILNCAPD